MPNPNISIILPTFNRDYVIADTIENILSQTFNNFELIIIDDASTDQTSDIIKSYQEKDNRIIYIQNKTNYGCAKSRCIGLDNTTANIIVFLDDDDKWNINKLKKQYHIIKQDKSDMVISDYSIKNNNKLKYISMSSFSIDFTYNILLRPGPFLQCIMLKKNLINKISKPFDSMAIPSEEWDFFIEVSKQNLNISYIQESLFTWNLNANSQSMDFKHEADALAYIFNKHYQYAITKINKKIMSEHYRRIARVYEKTNSINQINKFYKKAFTEYPFSIKNIFYRALIFLGYKNTKPLITWMRKLRGIPNE